MRKKYKFKQETPELLKKMGLDKLYQEHIEMLKEREKTHRVIWIKNPPHYKCKACKEDIWNAKEDLFTITAETMFGKVETFNKEDLYYEND
jgi:hypothetical protein